MNWLPNRFSLKKPEGGLIVLCRFSNNWAQKVEEPRSWRNGLTRTVKNSPTKEGNLQPTQSPRAKVITQSWKRWYKESKHPKWTPELRQTFKEDAQRRLERARYVEFMDWLHRWEAHSRTTSSAQKSSLTPTYAERNRPPANGRKKPWDPRGW